MSFNKIPLIGNNHGDETRNIINLMVQVINNRGIEILSDSAFVNWLHENGVKHLGEWSNKKEYDRQSVVIHEGNSYTSKKRVPVGIDISNEEFWVITGNYNAQVEYYRDETERVANELDKKSDITYVNAEINKTVKKNELFVNLDDFINPNNSTYESIMTAIDYCNVNNRDLYIPYNTFEINKNEKIVINKPIRIFGDFKGTSIIKSDYTDRELSLIEIDSDNVVIEGLGLESNKEVWSAPISILKGNNNVIRDNTFLGGFIGIWLNPKSNSEILKTFIHNNKINNVNYGVYLGSTRASGSLEKIRDLMITENIMYGGLNIGSGGDGIKTAKKVDSVNISNNIIEGFSRDGLDLFASGNKIMVTNNIIRGNTVKGIDIKSSITSYPENIHGKNGTKINITGNIIEDSGRGMTVSMNSIDGDYNNLINISENIFFDNKTGGISVGGKYINVKGNMIFNNGLTEENSTSAAGILIGNDRDTYYSEFLNVIDNFIINNHSTLNDNINAVRVTSRVKNLLFENNVVLNDDQLEGEQKRGLYVNAQTSDIKLLNNKIRNHSLQDITIVGGAGVVGKELFIPIKDIPTDSNYNEYIGYIGTCNFYNFSILPAKDIQGKSSNFSAIALQKKNPDSDTESGYDTISSISTQQSLFSDELKTNNLNIRYEFESPIRIRITLGDINDDFHGSAIIVKYIDS